jgi:hypothetical protein
MLRRAAVLALLLLPSVAAAQRAGPMAPPPDSFESWTPVGQPLDRPALPAGAELRSRDRAGNAVLGGIIGAGAGVVFCTVVSNIAKDEGTGFSTCTTKGYLLTGGIGLALGLVVGLLV